MPWDVLLRIIDATGEIQDRSGDEGEGQTLDISEVLPKRWRCSETPDLRFPRWGAHVPGARPRSGPTNLEGVHDGCMLLCGRTNANCRPVFQR
jgi:hypothetical protein